MDATTDGTQGLLDDVLDLGNRKESPVFCAPGLFGHLEDSWPLRQLTLLSQLPCLADGQMPREVTSSKGRWCLPEALVFVNNGEGSPPPLVLQAPSISIYCIVSL